LLALKKKISKFSAPQPLAEAENLIGLREKIFKIFRTTRVAWGGNFAQPWIIFYLALEKKILNFSTPT
jgi:hypothetical protein